MKITYDIIIRSNRSDYKIKDRLCSGTCYEEGDKMVFELEQTRNWFARDSFNLMPGFKVIPEVGPFEYVVTEIRYPEKRPFKTTLVTERLPLNQADCVVLFDPSSPISLNLTTMDFIAAKRKSAHEDQSSNDETSLTTPA